MPDTRGPLTTFCGAFDAPTFRRLGEGDELLIAVFSFTDDQIRDAMLGAWDRGAEVRIMPPDDAYD